MAKKNKNIKVKLVSTQSHHFYTKSRNVKMPGGPKKDGKLSGLYKYDPIIRKHVEYLEKKIEK